MAIEVLTYAMPDAAPREAFLARLIALGVCVNSSTFTSSTNGLRSRPASMPSCFTFDILYTAALDTVT
eukprot:CAMPEP_0198214150 /NCGR_PEP_ID=MMETSP1445-20131203/38206_1 /TAXON_ID=36898 /ORGANISM="Pyramimonas sp., Strain CCMP2087" /LENGTH=67 /DNA_ID=CAMNT_0043889187 /DNA_START=1257 /DNA_END=1460 /DNA_ORIENTATION=-